MAVERGEVQTLPILGHHGGLARRTAPASKGPDHWNLTGRFTTSPPRIYPRERFKRASLPANICDIGASRSPDVEN